MRGSLAASAAGKLGVLALDTAARWHRTGTALDLVHGLLRAHLYAAGLREAGGIPAPVAAREHAALTA
jgi:hypothetical protein